MGDLSVSGTATTTQLSVTSTSTLGTVISGIWQGDVIGTAYGGTGLSSLGSANQILGVNSGATGLEYKNIASLLSAGSGISISGTNIATISNTGILSLTAGPGISISSGQNPTITNIGVLSLNSATGTLTLQGTTNQINVTTNAGTITLSLPQDIATTSSPTFSGLTLSSLTPGSVLFAGSGGIISQDNSNLFWDATNKRLGIGTSTPAGILHVATGTVNALVVDNSGNVGIGTTSPTHPLTVLGDSLVSGVSYLGGTKKKATGVTTANMTIWVDSANGSDTTGDGSETNPYATINRAMQDVPEGIAHKVTIQLKASSVTYSRGYIQNRVFLSPTASLTIQGTMTVLDSGTISSVTQGVNDPVYGSSVLVDKIVDSTKSWTTNAYKYKILHVYKTGVGEHYRVITNNSATEIFVSYKFYSPIPDNTWSYEILDWGSTVDGLSLYNLQGSVYLYFLKSDTATPYPLSADSVLRLIVTACAFIKESGASHAFRYSDAFVSMSSSLLDGTNTNYDGIVPSYGRFARGEFYGVIIRRFRYGLWFSGVGGFCYFRDGSRVLKDDATISQNDIFLDGNTLINFYSPFGKVVLDNGPTGLYARSGARIQYDNYIYFGPNVTTQKSITDGLDNAGNFYVSGNVGIGTTNPTNILTVVQNSATDPIADAWTTYSTPESKIVLGTADEEAMDYLEKFKDLPVYKWKRNEKEQMRLGVLAVTSTPPEILAYDAEGKIQGIDLGAYIGFLHEVMKGQQKEIEELKLALNEYGILGTSTEATSSEQSIFDRFTLAIKKSLEKLGLFIENGIATLKEIFAEKVTTKQICLEGDDGETICVDKNQLKQLLQQTTNNSQQTTNNSQPTTDNSQPTPTPTPESSPTPTPTPEPTPTEQPTPTPSPSPSPTPTPEPSPN